MGEQSKDLDVAIIGGGPTGLSACLEISRCLGSECKAVIIENDSELGGIPRTCNIFFGMRDLRRLYTGATYANRLSQSVRNSTVSIHTDSTVLKIIPGNGTEKHTIEVLSPSGIEVYHCPYILLATGCYEAPRAMRVIPGPRQSGVFTTGSLQEIVHERGEKPGNRAVILGSEHVAFSSAITLKKAGVSIVGLVEEGTFVNTYSWIAKAMSAVYRFPIYTETSVESIIGTDNVEGVALMNNRTKRRFTVPCDTVIMTGKLRSYSPLIDNTAITMDVSTAGPMVDNRFMTSVPGIFAAGNVLRGADMHDLCAIEGREAAQRIIQLIKGKDEVTIDEYTHLRAEFPVRHIVPQKISIRELDNTKVNGHRICVSMQLAYTIPNPTLEAWSGNELIWSRTFSKLIGNNRVVLPLHTFKWDHKAIKHDIVVKLKDPTS